MKSAVETLTPTRAKLTVEVPFEELKPSLDKAYKTIAQQINIPGFRRGKVPPAVIDRQVGQMVRLVDDLLDINRITRGKLRLTKEQVDLRVVAVGLRRRRLRPGPGPHLAAFLRHRLLLRPVLHLAAVHLRPPLPPGRRHPPGLLLVRRDQLRHRPEARLPAGCQPP